MKSILQRWNFRILLFSFFIITLLIVGSVVAGVVADETKDTTGNVQITAENDYIKLVIVPAYGGMVTGFTYKATGNQWVIPDTSGQNLNGMFADHIRPPEMWPGECMSSKYDYQIIRNSPDQVTIKLWYRMKPDGPVEECGRAET